MATKTSIIIDKSAGQTKKQQSITNVNPNATDKQMYDFAQGLVSLSTDSFDGATRVDRKDLEATEYVLVGANAIYMEFTGNTNDDYAVTNYMLMDSNNEPVAAKWSLTAINAIPSGMINFSNMDTTEAYRSGYIGMQAASTTGVTGEYVYQIAAVYNEITYTKQVRIYLFEKGE